MMNIYNSLDSVIDYIHNIIKNPEQDLDEKRLQCVITDPDFAIYCGLIAGYNSKKQLKKTKVLLNVLEATAINKMQEEGMSAKALKNLGLVLKRIKELVEDIDRICRPIWKKLFG